MECLAGAAVVQSRLTTSGTVLAVADPGESAAFGFASLAWASGAFFATTNHGDAVDFFGFGHEVPNDLFLDAVENRCGNFEAERLGSNTEVGFEHLTDVHPRRHAERIEADVDGRAVVKEGHVFFGNDRGDNALVSVATGHLVTDRELALGGDEDLHFLDDAGIDFVAGLERIEPALAIGVEFLEAAFEGTDDFQDLVADRRWVDLDVIVHRCQLAQQGLGDLAVRGDDDFAGLRVDDIERDFLIEKDVGQTIGEVVGQFVGLLLVLVVDLLERLLQLVRIDLLLALLGEAALRDADILNDADATGWHAQRGVLHIGGLLTEDRAQQALFGSEFRFRLRSDLADEDVAGLHFRADADDAVVVEVAESFFANIRNVASDFFRSELGVTGGDIEFRNVDRGVNILFHDFFGDDDGVLEVVTVPWHEGHQHVAADGEFAVFGVWSVGEHLALLDLLTFLDDRLLVDAGAGVRAHELAQRVGHDAFGNIRLHRIRIAEEFLFGNRHGAIGSRDDDFRRGGGNDAVGFGDHHRTRIASSFRFETGADERCFGNEKRHALALHVRAHERAVRVVVLKERNQTCGDGDQLLGRNVHVVDIGRQRLDELTTLFTGGDALGEETAFFVDRVVCLGDEEIFLLVGGEVFDLVGDLAIAHFAIRRLDEAELIDAGVGTHRVDQTDVRTFRCFDRADAAVVRWMNVADFEACAIAVETARSKCRKTALVGELGERVGLVHELRQLAAAEEIADDGGERLRVDQFLRRHAFDVHIEKGHALFHQTLGAGEADAALVGEKLTDRTHAARAKVIDVINDAVAFLELEDVTHGGEEILGDHDALIGVDGDAELLVDLVTADAGEVVFLRIEEKALEQRAGIGGGRRIAGAQLAIDVFERGLLVLGGIFAERLEKDFVLTTVDHLDAVVAERDQLAHDADRERLVGFRDRLLAVEDVLEGHFVAELAFVHLVAELEIFQRVEMGHDVAVGRIAKHAQESRRKELAAAAAAIEINIEQVVGIELHFEP